MRITNSTLSKRRFRHEKARSAGFVLTRPADLGGSGRAYLLLKHRHGDHWSFPKGTVEPGESDWEAAVRELAEEAGIAHIQRLRGFRHRVRYQFQRQATVIDKTVIYYLATTPQRQIVLSPEHTEGGWFDYPAARERLTHDNARQLLDAAEVFLKERG